MKHKLYAFILTISLAFIFSGCVAVENPVEAVIDNTSENLNETESETIAETTETTSSELITLDTSTDITSMQSSDSATTTITESKPLPESLELSLYKDLTQEDIELFRPYKELMLHISEENIDISLLAQLDSLKKLTIYRNGYPGVYYNGEPTSYASDFSFLNGMNLTELDIECGKTKLCLNEIKLENLESLTINYADIIISDELLNFPALKELSLRYSDINSIDPFCELRL